ncbi:MAG: hypothetical protein PHP45_01310 [Elusimicrobiales bacterium]|nr:hypothetical protein [Elusimicrobiales bacterium]
MNDEEKKVLHGLYFDMGVGNPICIKSGEILWLINASMPEGKTWKIKDEKRKSFDIKIDNFREDYAHMHAISEKVLQYLTQEEFITCSKRGMFPEEYFEISVTSAGADFARELDSRFGRLNILYKDHRDGVFGLIITVFVSGIVSIITTMLTKHWVK